MTVHFPFENTYAALPSGFFARVLPTPVASPRLIKLNRPLAKHLGLDPDRLASPEGTEILAGKLVPDGADPIAMAYAGHQFGHFVPQLGDGRAILLDEPFEGLAPVIVRDLVKACRDLAAAGQTIVLVEQNLAATLALASRVYIINNGHIVHEGPAQEIKAQPEILQHYLGV